MQAKFLPWRPTVTLTGTAYYSVDCSGVTGQIMSRRDDWDAVENSSYFSVSQPSASLVVPTTSTGCGTAHCIACWLGTALRLCC